MSHSRIWPLTSSNISLILLFGLICALTVYVGHRFKQEKLEEYHHDKFTAIADSMVNEVKTLIVEKQNATLAIALSLTQSTEILSTLESGNYSDLELNEFSLKLRDETDFKNVWIQLINKKGISFARSWTAKRGDDLSKIREDVRSMIRQPRVKTTISVGKFDMSFKSMVPIFDKDQEFLGTLEIITHFNSIAEKIKDKGFKPVIMTNVKYRKQIKHPFTRKFAGDNYIANKNADEKLMEYIGNKGLEYFISAFENFVVDENGKFLVINHAMLDTEDRPMADFLMFKPLGELDLESAKSISTSTNLLMALFLLTVGFLLYLLSNKKNDSAYDTGIKRSKRQIFIFSGLFISISVVLSLFLYWSKESRVDTYLTDYNQTMQRDYFILHNKLRTLANMLFESSINQPEIAELIYQASHGDKKDKDKTRELLFSKLYGTYQTYKKYGLRQLHFHLPDNESFLRFHRPGKYGDNLTNFRKTVARTNAELVITEGFEGGRIYNGFRYVFPLFYIDDKGQHKHVGSVETSFSAHTIAEEYANSHDARLAFLVSKESTREKVFKDELHNYDESEFPSYFYESSTRLLFERTQKQAKVNQLELYDRGFIEQQIAEGEFFTLSAKNDNALFTFIPIRNTITKDVVAVLIIQVEDRNIAQINLQFITITMVSMISLFLLLLTLYKESTHRQNLDILQKTRQILDVQDSYVFLTRNSETVEVNKKFLRFLGFESLSDIQKQLHCICDRFLGDPNRAYLQKTMDGIIWIEYLKNNPNPIRDVKIKDSYGNPHIFHISLDTYDADSQLDIVTLSEITEKIHYQAELEEKNIELQRLSITDKLTGLFNRNRLDHLLNEEFERATRYDHDFSLTIMDIDHFKRVNDTHGHLEGDRLLQEISAILMDNVRKVDIVGRWGGEEFLIIYPNTDLSGAAKVAELIREQIAESNFSNVGYITASFGVACYEPNDDLKNLLKRADNRLYQAKQQGRNRVISD